MKFKVGDKVKVFGFLEADNRPATVVIANPTGCDVKFDEPINGILADLTFSISNDSLELVPRYHIPPEMFKDSEEFKKKFSPLLHAKIAGSGRADVFNDLANNAAKEVFQEYQCCFTESESQFKVGDRVAVNRIRMPEWKGMAGYIKEVVNDHSYKVVFDDNSTGIQFHSSQLDRLPSTELLSEAIWFKIGDEVKITKGPNRGKTGWIVNDSHRDMADNIYYMISHDRSMNGGWYALADELVFASVAQLPSEQDLPVAAPPCKLCKGTGKLQMLNNYVPCDCVASDTEQ